MNRALQSAEALNLDRAQRARALCGAGCLTMLQGDFDAARSLQQESLMMSREVGDKGLMASALNELGSIAWHEGDTGAARSAFEESLQLSVTSTIVVSQKPGSKVAI